MMGIRNVTKEPYKGIQAAGLKFIPTGFEAIDNAINEMYSRKATIITGQSEEGKSAVAHRIGLNAIAKGYRILIVDGEYYQEELISILYQRVIGNDKRFLKPVKLNRVYVNDPSDYAHAKIREWHKNKLYIYSKNDGPVQSLDEMYKIIEDGVIENKIDLVLLDNMMSLVSSTQAERNSVQADFIKKINAMNKKHNCHSLIVAHPRQQQKRGIELDIFDISGTTDIPNSVDNVLIVRRNFDKEEEIDRMIYYNQNPENSDRYNEPDGWLYLKKNKRFGKHAVVDLKYDFVSQNYYEMTKDGIIELDYNWNDQGKQTGFVAANEGDPF